MVEVSFDHIPQLWHCKSDRKRMLHIYAVMLETAEVSFDPMQCTAIKDIVSCDVEKTKIVFLLRPKKQPWYSVNKQTTLNSEQ